MNSKSIDTIIIGGGISGLHAASLLAKQGRPFRLVEARNRLGGRIFSPNYKQLFTDLGPSWFWPAIQPRMVALIKKLGLDAYRQYEDGFGRHQLANGSVRTMSGYTMEPQSWRLKGGMQALVTGLAAEIPPTAVRLNQPVCTITKTDNGALVGIGILEQKPLVTYKVKQVIMALPPRLAAASILFTPDLAPHLGQAMLKMGTWMAGEAKFCAVYDEPFWRKNNLSGQAFSQRGPMVEIHDGSNGNEGPYALVGFVGIPAAGRGNKEILQQAIIAQLDELFGKQAHEPLSCFYQDWACEPYTATRFDQQPMREHPEYRPPAGKTAFWGETIRFAGTETADQQGGYLEGALMAAERSVSG
ncbi:MAG: FAD-dependent oxidoreductase [Deltaproteobacteria bacterium]|nr:FAD-dependent oxidoreductase [Candidatus Anaeroferrophillus wilburensis]MBN2888714.1 FAD-dependent oxidoreductase [Deltaproteobacteria bacterium]